MRTLFLLPLILLAACGGAPSAPTPVFTQGQITSIQTACTINGGMVVEVYTADNQPYWTACRARKNESK